MDVKLEKLIEKIKDEGIKKAEQESSEIIAKAKSDAEAIIKDAEKESQALIEEAQKKVDKLQISGKSALQQAERDAVLVTKEKLTKLFDRVFKSEISGVLKPELIKELILKMVENANDNNKMIALVNKNEVESLEKLLVTKTKGSLKDSVEIKVDKGISNGFRIGLKGDNVYYDFTDESISGFLREFLNPSIQKMLND